MLVNSLSSFWKSHKRTDDNFDINLIYTKKRSWNNAATNPKTLQTNHLFIQLEKAGLLQLNNYLVDLEEEEEKKIRLFIHHWRLNTSSVIYKYILDGLV